MLSEQCNASIDHHPEEVTPVSRPKDRIFTKQGAIIISQDKWMSTKIAIFNIFKVYKVTYFLNSMWLSVYIRDKPIFVLLSILCPT